MHRKEIRCGGLSMPCPWCGASGGAARCERARGTQLTPQSTAHAPVAIPVRAGHFEPACAANANAEYRVPSPSLPPAARADCCA
eukprot:gene19515-biopygen32709